MKAIVLIVTMIATMATEVFGSPNFFKNVWDNDITSCDACTEIARGRYVRDGVEKPFLLLRKSTNSPIESMAVYLTFLDAQGDKYLIFSKFLPKMNKIETRQAAVLPEIDPDRPRIIAAPMDEELRNTNISPLFLTLSLHLVKKYRLGELAHGTEAEVVVDDEARNVLPHKIYVRVEENNGIAAPVEIQMYRDKEVISTIHIKNGSVGDRLRPFWMSFTARRKTDKVFIDSWGMVPSDNEFFTLTGLGRGDISIPPMLSMVLCPPEICKKD